MAVEVTILGRIGGQIVKLVIVEVGRVGYRDAPTKAALMKAGADAETRGWAARPARTISPAT